eukprot:scaffold332_cov308-Pavlova_lutheri.AAC.8
MANAITANEILSQSRQSRVCQRKSAQRKERQVIGTSGAPVGEQSSGHKCAEENEWEGARPRYTNILTSKR